MAMLVHGLRVPSSISSLDTVCFRFSIDCENVCVGQRVAFFVWCRDRDAGDALGKDDDGGKCYSLICCSRGGAKGNPNPWAAEAARRLAEETAPIVRFNKKF